MNQAIEQCHITAYQHPSLPGSSLAGQAFDPVLHPPTLAWSPLTGGPPRQFTADLQTQHRKLIQHCTALVSGALKRLGELFGELFVTNPSARPSSQLGSQGQGGRGRVVGAGWQGHGGRGRVAGARWQGQEP